MGVASASMALALSGCGTLGTWGNDNPEGSLSISLSEGLHEELSAVKHDREYTIRFTLRNTESTPIQLDGIGVRASYGAAKFVDAKAVTRESGDREARVFAGFPPEDEDVDVSDWKDVTATRVKPHQVVDIYVGVTYTAGEQAGFEGFDVHYEAKGADEVTAALVEVDFCQGDMVDRDECADRSLPMNKNVSPATTTTAAARSSAEDL